MLAKKINLKECLKVVKNLKRLKKKVVMTNGCFDIVHSGHVDYLHKRLWVRRSLDFHRLVTTRVCSLART